MKKFITISVLSVIVLTANANTPKTNTIDTDLLAQSIKAELQKDISEIKTVELKKATTPKAVFIAQHKVSKQKSVTAINAQPVEITTVAEDE